NWCGGGAKTGTRGCVRSPDKTKPESNFNIQMHKQILTLIASMMTLAVIPILAQSAPTPSASPPAQHVQRYTCPMHPEIVRAEPGQCPKCGMTLVLMKENGKRPTPNTERPMPKSEHASHQHMTHDANGTAVPQHEHAEHEHEMK